MKLVQLTREILAHKSRRGLATVSFTRRGIVILSNLALNRLELKNDSLVDIFQGDLQSEFFISRGNTYQLRKNGRGGAVFNSVDLSSLVIDKTWTITSHAYGVDCPTKFTFIICERPVDDEENKNVYALLRKKT
jgi:hypothetical protein